MPTSPFSPMASFFSPMGLNSSMMPPFGQSSPNEGNQLERRKAQIKELKKSLEQKNAIIKETQNKCQQMIQQAEQTVRIEMRKLVAQQEQELVEAKNLNHKLDLEVQNLRAQVEFLSQGNTGVPLVANTYTGSSEKSYFAPERSYSPPAERRNYSLPQEQSRQVYSMPQKEEETPFIQCPECMAYFEVSLDVFNSGTACCTRCGNEFQHKQTAPPQQQQPQQRQQQQPRVEHAVQGGKKIRCSFKTERFEVTVKDSDSWQDVVNQIKARMNFQVKKPAKFNLNELVRNSKIEEGKAILFM